MNQSSSEPETVYQIVQRLLNSTDTILIVANSCNDHINVRRGRPVGVRLSRETTDFFLMASNLFAVHSMALSICYLRGQKNLLDENPSEEAYLEALENIASCQLSRVESSIAEVTFFNTRDAVRYVFPGRRDSNETSHFLGFRTGSERTIDIKIISSTAKVLLKFIQETLGAQQVEIRRASPVEAQNYRA